MIEVKIYAVVIGVLVSLAAAAPAPAAVASDWDSIGSKPPARERVIEVVDAIPSSAWRVSAAVKWLDKRTASRMRLVKACTGKAYRCITFRAGRVGKASSGPVGWSQGRTITIDTAKARRGKYVNWYGSNRNRTWLLTHELGHQFGLAHSSDRNLMNEMVTGYRMTLTHGQRVHLRKR